MASGKKNLRERSLTRVDTLTPNDFTKPTYREYNDGSWEKYNYDDLGRLTDSKFSDGRWSKNTYSTDGMILRSESGLHEGRVDKWAEHKYDSLGNQVMYQDSDGNGERHDYDSVGNLVCVHGHSRLDLDRRTQSPYYATLGKKALYPKIVDEQRDNGGRLISRKFDNDATVSFKYGDDGAWEKFVKNAAGRQTCYEDSKNNWVEYEYDAQNRMTYSKDSNGTWKQWQYDQNGNEIYYEKEVDSYLYWQRSTYDDNGNKTRYETSEGNSSDYEYEG